MTNFEQDFPKAIALNECCLPPDWRGLKSLFLRSFPKVFGLLTLAPGYLADLILIDLTGVHHQPNHNVPANLVYSMRSHDVQTMIVDGKIVMRDRQILTVHKAEVISHVQAICERIK